MAKATPKKPSRRTAAGKSTRATTKNAASKKTPVALKPPAQAPPVRVPLPSAWRLIAVSVNIIRIHWRVLGGIALTYYILTLLFVQGIGNTAGGASSSSGSLMQSFLFILGSLVIIWALRQLASGQGAKVKQAFYLSQTPFVPFLLVLLVILLQLLPLLLASIAFNIVSDTGLNEVLWERVIWVVVLILGFSWSIYMLSSSVIAAYVVTLPGMEPRRALRLAKQVVKGHRISIIRKLVMLVLLVTLLYALLLIPISTFVNRASLYSLYVVNAIALLFIHTYLYSLYRELLGHD